MNKTALLTEWKVITEYQTLPCRIYLKYHIGIWGQRRLDYLRKHRRGFYAVLFTSGKLAEHLHEIDETVFERVELIVKQMMETQGATEQLKADDMMKWVGRVNNIRTRADEIIRNELIYDLKIPPGHGIENP